MKNDILNLILQSESEYRATVEKSEGEAEKYIETLQLKQIDYAEKLKNDWQLFEAAENEKLRKMISDEEQRAESETTEKKEQMKVLQTKKLEVISERLKKEVLSFDGDN